MSAGLVYSDVFTDFRFRLPAVRLAAAREIAGATTWMYRWDGLEADQNDGLASCHAAEIPFVFDRIAIADHSLLIGAHPSAALAATTHGIWVDFVATGAPGWAPYDSTARTTGLISERLDVVDDPAGDERAAWTRQPASAAVR